MRILAQVISKTIENSIIMYTIAIQAPHWYIIYQDFQERRPLPGSLVERKRRMLSGANLPVPCFYSPPGAWPEGDNVISFLTFFFKKSFFRGTFFLLAPCYGKRVRFPWLIPTLVTEAKCRAATRKNKNIGMRDSPNFVVVSVCLCLFVCFFSLFLS